MSDYGYAASPENWTVNIASLNNDTNRNNNWIFMGLTEWTITNLTDNSNQVFCVNSNGNLNNYWTYFNDLNGYAAAVRPSFHLESSIVLEGGTGTASNPYRIA